MKPIVLTGGYINAVTRNEECVAKHFQGEHLTGIPAIQRMRREALALKHFGRTLAPQLLASTNNTIYQQFIEGKTYADLMKDEPNIELVRDAGRLLASIHEPIHRPFAYLQEELEHKIKLYTYKSKFLLDRYLGKQPAVDINWDEVKKFGSTRVHRDLWLGNIINGIAIDWEFSGIGSPYEDFAIEELWIFMEYEGKKEFYEQYGRVPDENTVRQFLKLKCMQFISTGTPDIIENEESGFYKNKLQILEELN